MSSTSLTLYVAYKAIPHAFLMINDGANKRYFGFAPSTRFAPINPGKVGVGLTTEALGDPDNIYAGFIDDAAWSKTITISPIQCATMLATVKQWQTHTPEYRLFTQNCTDFVLAVMASAGVSYGGIRGEGPDPMDLIPLAERKAFYVFDPETGQSHPSDVLRDPVHCIGTPAYAYYQNPASFA